MPAAVSTQPFVAFLNVATPTAGTNSAVFDYGWCVLNQQMTVTSGAGVSAGAVQLQGSIDGSNFYNISTPLTVPAAGTTGFAGNFVVPTRYLRAQVSTTVVGGSITVVLAGV